IISSIEHTKIESKDACTMISVEMLDAATEMVFPFLHHIGVQTLDSSNISRSTKIMQDKSTSCSDEFDLGYNNARLCSCKLICQNNEKVSKKDYATQTEKIYMREFGTLTVQNKLISCCVQTENNLENPLEFNKETNNHSEIGSQHVNKRRKSWEYTFTNRTSEQKSSKNTENKPITMIRYDYMKSKDSGVKNQLTKLEKLVNWLCSSDDNCSVSKSNEHMLEENSSTSHVIKIVPPEKETTEESSTQLSLINKGLPHRVQNVGNNEKEMDNAHYLTSGSSTSSETEQCSIENKMKWENYAPAEFENDRNPFYKKKHYISKVGSNTPLDSNRSGINQCSREDSYAIPTSLNSDNLYNHYRFFRNEDYYRNSNEVPSNFPNVQLQFPFQEHYMHMNNMLYQLALQSMSRACVSSCCCQNAGSGRCMSNNQCPSQSNATEIPHCNQHSSTNNCKNDDVCEEKFEVRRKNKDRWKRIIMFDDNSNDLKPVCKNRIIDSSDSEPEIKTDERYHSRPKRKIFNKKRSIFKKLRRKFVNKKLKITDKKSVCVKNIISESEESVRLNSDDDVNREKHCEDNASFKELPNRTSLLKPTSSTKDNVECSDSNIDASNDFEENETSTLGKQVEHIKKNTENSPQANLLKSKSSFPSHEDLFGSENDLSSDEECGSSKRRKLSEDIDNKENSNLPLIRKKGEIMHEDKEKAEEENNTISDSLPSREEFKNLNKGLSVSRSTRRKGTLTNIPSVGTSKLSKLEKYRRILLKAKLPSKIPCDENLQKTKRKLCSEEAAKIERSCADKNELLEVEKVVEINAFLNKPKTELELSSDTKKTLSETMERIQKNNVKNVLHQSLPRLVTPKNIGISTCKHPQKSDIPVQLPENQPYFSVDNKRNCNFGVSPLNISNLKSGNGNVINKSLEMSNNYCNFIQDSQNETSRESYNSLHNSDASPSFQQSSDLLTDKVVSSLDDKCHVSNSSIKVLASSECNRNIPVFPTADHVNTVPVVSSVQNESCVEIKEEENKSVPNVNYVSHYLDSPVKQYHEMPHYLDSPVKQPFAEMNNSVTIPSIYHEISQHDSPEKQPSAEIYNFVPVPSMYREISQHDSPEKQPSAEIDNFVPVPSMYREISQHDSPEKQPSAEIDNFVPVPSMYREISQHDSPEKQPSAEIDNFVPVPSMYREISQYDSPERQPSEKMEDQETLVLDDSSSVCELISHPVSPIKEFESNQVSKEENIASMSNGTEGNSVPEKDIGKGEHSPSTLLAEMDGNLESETNIPALNETAESSARVTRHLAREIQQNDAKVEKTDFDAGSILHKAIASAEVRKTGKRRGNYTEAKTRKEQKKVIGEALNKLLSDDSNIEVLKTIVSELGQLPAVKNLSKYMVKYIRNDVDGVKKGCGVSGIPLLSQAQERLLTLLYNLHSEYKQYKKLPHLVLLGIEYCLFRLGSAPPASSISSLARFYAALCRLLCDKKRLQVLCYDALYCLTYKAYPVMYAVLKTCPDAIPHAEVGKDNLLITCMTSILLTQKAEKCYADFMVEPVKKILSTHYGYKADCSLDKLFNLLLSKLTNTDDGIEHLEASIILVAKRLGYEAIYKKLITKIFYPMLNDWKNGTVKDEVIEQMILIIGYIARCFPVTEAKIQILELMNHLRSILIEENEVSMKVQEAAVISLLRLSRISFIFVASVLLNWRPKSEVSHEVMKEVHSLFSVRNPKWWRNFLDNGLCKSYV
ncbi:hypothetical protein L9F63_004161, partial [Diploptera punctata]